MEEELLVGIIEAIAEEVGKSLCGGDIQFNIGPDYRAWNPDIYDWVFMKADEQLLACDVDVDMNNGYFALIGEEWEIDYELADPAFPTNMINDIHDRFK